MYSIRITTKYECVKMWCLKMGKKTTGEPHRHSSFLRGTWRFTMQIMWVLFPPGWHGAVHGMNIAWETIAVCQARQFARRKRTAVCGSFVNRVFFGTRSWPRHVLFQANTEALQMDQHKKTGENQVKGYIPLVRHRNPSKSIQIQSFVDHSKFSWL